MDGVGIGAPNAANAVYVAKTPFLDKLTKSPLYREIKAHGTAVGMPSDEDMGNSEVGHNALGAGRVFKQGATLVEQAIKEETIYKTPLWKKIVYRSQEKTLHFIGLLSDGNVHAHINHLLTMLEKVSEQGVKTVRVHPLLDGRDVDGRSALTYIERLETCLAKLSQKEGCDYRIASGGGRMLITMDRYNAEWEMVEKGWKTHVLGEANPVSSASEAIENAYKDPTLNDQYIPAFTVVENGKPVGPIEDGESVIFYNFRGDRAIEISQAFTEKDFDKFDRKRVPEVLYTGMMEYDGDKHIPEHYLVNPPQIEHPMGAYLCAEGLRSFAISETQKYGHVTFFWNGNNSGYIDETLETYIEIPSDRCVFNEKPEMKAIEITEKTIELIASGKVDFGRINYPNGDMVGHTGDLAATIKAVEVTDQCVEKVCEAVKEKGGVTIVLADHGNADLMYIEKDEKKIPRTAHTLNPVPFAIVTSGDENRYELSKIKEAGLANVAATVFNLLGFEAPADYEPSLITYDKK